VSGIVLTVSDVPFWATFVSGGIGAIAALGGAVINQTFTSSREKSAASSKRTNELADEVRERSMRAAEKAFESTLELLDAWRAEPTDADGRVRDIHEPILRRLSTRAAIIEDQEVRHGVYHGVESVEGVEARHSVGDLDKETPAQECRWIAGHIRDVLGAYMRNSPESVTNHDRALTGYRDRTRQAIEATTA
jgi:hypothetical protein